MAKGESASFEVFKRIHENRLGDENLAHALTTWFHKLGVIKFQGITEGALSGMELEIMENPVLCWDKLGEIIDKNTLEIRIRVYRRIMKQRIDGVIEGLTENKNREIDTNFLKEEIMKAVEEGSVSPRANLETFKKVLEERLGQFGKMF